MLLFYYDLQSEIDARSGSAGANARVPQVLEAADVGVERAQASVVDYVRFVMDSDRKLGPMKSLQVRHNWIFFCVTST